MYICKCEFVRFRKSSMSLVNISTITATVSWIATDGLPYQNRSVFHSVIYSLLLLLLQMRMNLRLRVFVSGRIFYFN